jgi:hypothetical protein
MQDEQGVFALNCAPDVTECDQLWITSELPPSVRSRPRCHEPGFTQAGKYPADVGGVRSYTERGIFGAHKVAWSCC